MGARLSLSVERVAFKERGDSTVAGATGLDDGEAITVSAASVDDNYLQ
jgi:hypothetical protein